MDDPYIVKPSKLKKFYPVPLGSYQVQITDATYKEEVNPFDKPEAGEQPEMRELYDFEFTILDKRNFDYKDEDGEQQIESTRGRRVWKKINKALSASGKNAKASWLYKLLCAVENKEIPQEELQELDVRTLVGQQVIVMLEVKGQWNNILGFAHAEKELESVPNASERVQKEQVKIEEPSTGNPKSEDEFIKGLEEAKKVEDMSEEEVDKVMTK